MKKSTAFISVALISTLLQAEQIKKINFSNLSRISPKIANETIGLNVGDKLDIEKINSAIKEFYKFGYFDDISVQNNNGVLDIIFKEKPSIANITIKGYKQREEEIELLHTVMGVRKGGMFTPKKIENAKKALLKELEKESYVNSVVEVEIEHLSNSSVALTFDVNKGDEIIIKKVNYFGSDNLDTSDFEGVTANKEADYFSWFFGQNSGEVKIDQLPYEQPRINDIYFQNGYLDSKVEKPFMKIDFASNEAELNFFINEGNQYRVNDIKIFLDSSILDPETLYSDLKLIKDRVFNIKKLRQDVDFIKTAVADLGYAFANVRYDIKKDEKNNVADIIFNVIPGEKVYINDVIISGNSRTLDRAIRRNIFLAHGDLFNLTDFNDSKNKLGRTGYFEKTTIEQKRVSDTKMDLLVNVTEAPTGSLIVGGGYGSYQGFEVTGSIKDKNIFGSGLGIGISAEVSNVSSDFTLSLDNPSINDSDYNGDISLYKDTREVTYTDYKLDKEILGLSVGAGKFLTRNVSAGARYKLEAIQEEYDINTKTDKDYIKSSITPYINYNSTDDYYLPREGIRASASFETAGLGGDSKYFKSINKFSYFYGLDDAIGFDAIFRYRFQINNLIDNGNIAEGDSFYLGGPKSVRGYESFAFGPDDAVEDAPYKKMLANTIEVSFPLIPSAKMRASIFYDHGTIGKSSYNEIKKSGTGAVLEWNSPLGPLSLIFAKAINPDPGDKTSSFEFQLGSSF